MRVLVSDDDLESEAASWWRQLPPWRRAVLIQALWECGHGGEESDPEQTIRASNKTTEVCSRCGSALNNVAPGFSVVAGGQTVCTPCLQPGEEVARARSIT